MAKVPVPDRGQPLDVTYIYTLAQAINEVSESVSLATSNYTSIDQKAPQPGRQDLKNNNAKIYASYYDVINNETVTANTTKTWTINFASNFKYPPIVVATPINTGTSDIGNDVLAVITSVTTSQVNGIVRFNSSGSQVSTTINVIAIGIPG